MPLSKDPSARRAQLDNLKRGQLTHGASTEALIRPLAEAYLAELVGEFPSASERVLRVQARRLAKLDRLGVYLDGRGEIRHRRRGEVFPASALEEQVSAAYLAEHRRLEAVERDAGAGRPGDPLARIAAELAAGEDAEDEQAGGVDTDGGNGAQP